jgi:putative inorganic carbon (HCO3(-)) transporter
MRDLYVALIYLSFLVVGAAAPFVCTLGYVWVDIFYPQLVTSDLDLLPVAMVMAVAAIGSYLLFDRRAPPRWTAHTTITLLFAGWVTLTLAWAEVPDMAWAKWDWAFKTVLFSAFLPFAIRSRVQIEAFLQVVLFAMALHMLPLAIKSAISGSSYGRGLGVVNGNALLLESSTLAAVSISLIPIILFLRRHAILLPRTRSRDALYLGLVGIAVLCAVGTYARTAMVGFVVVGAAMWLQSRRKLVFALVLVAAACVFAATASSQWEDRIATTADYNEESSALGRILVWQWTLGYVAEHPLGGGFNAYYIDTISFPGVDGGAPVIIHGKAYHNIFFEILGEHGIPGLAMFCALVLLSFGCLRQVRARTRARPEFAWCFELAGALGVSLLTLLACGNFVGIGFQSTVWYALAAPVCLREYVRRAVGMEHAGPPRFAGRPVTPGGGLAVPDTGLPRDARCRAS